MPAQGGVFMAGPLGRLHLVTDVRRDRDPVAAQAAVAAGATYLGVGPAFATRTKHGLPDPLGAAGIRAVAAAVTVPVIAIGAVTAARVPALLAAGAYGVAVVTAISDAP